MTDSFIVDICIARKSSSFFNTLISIALAFLQINQATHDQALVLQSALQNIPNPASECMLRNVAIRLAQQISDEVTENVRNKIFQVCKNIKMSTSNGKEIELLYLH